MKKTLILAAIVLMSASCYAQKNPLVKKSKSIMMSENADFSEARRLMGEALEAEQTAEVDLPRGAGQQIEPAHHVYGEQSKGHGEE